MTNTTAIKQTADLSRIQRLRESVRVDPELCVERAYLMTLSYQETEAYPEVIRRAKALEKVLNEMTIRIEPEELIVGKTTSKRRGGILTPDINLEWTQMQVDLPSDNWDQFGAMTHEEYDKTKKVFAYWKGRSLYDRLQARVPRSILDQLLEMHVPAGSCISNMHLGSHDAVDYPMLLTLGLNGVKKIAEEKISGLDIKDPGDLKKHQFYTAVIICLEAVCNHAGRYAKLAKAMAGKENNPERKAELEKIAENCSTVLRKPATTFYEALQSVWLTYIVLMIEGWGPGMCIGRIDQYLYPYYKRDLEKGIITSESALELLAMFGIKLNEQAMRFSFEDIKTAASLTMLSNMTLGGITKDGDPAVNELSYLCLEAEKLVRMSGEEFVIRVNKNTPQAFLMKAVETAKQLNGKLKFISDETAIQQLLSDGKKLEHARDYIVSGCVMPTVPGVAWDVIGGQFSLPLMLELALNDGKSRLTGKQIGPQTGDAGKFKTYEDLWNAYKKQVEAVLPTIVLIRNIDRQLYADYLPTPFQSSLFPACLEKGKDIVDSGTYPYMTDGISIIGSANVGDSLAAIKKVVFDDKKTSLTDLNKALDNNFKGADDLLALLKNAPKFGNDLEYVDSIMQEVFVHLSKIVATYKGVDSTYALSSYVSAGNILLGVHVGALPDGRKAGEPLSEGGVSPYQGRNVNGPTSTMKSIIRLDVSKFTGGTGLNMKFNPEALKDDVKMKKFIAMLRTYLESGGYHIQFNIISTDTLREAQKHPEQYKDLLVRVATYSAFFVQLGPECQKEIIDRTEFQEIY